MYMNTEGMYGKYILQDIILPQYHTTPEAVKEYEDAGRRRILWMDAQSMPGSSLQTNSSWIVHADRELQLAREAAGTAGHRAFPHAHDCDELVAFIGTNPDEPSDLCGEIEFHIEGEKHILTKSSYIFLPAGVRHTPQYINRVDRPIFHFSLVLSPTYTQIHG